MPVNVSISQRERYVPATAADNRAIRGAGQLNPGGESDTGRVAVMDCSPL